MIRLSALIITYNEEDTIGRCIDSLQDVADEIIVLDSFSDDSTSKICKEKGVKFEQHKFEGYVEQKNHIMTLAQYPHLLSLDADEVLSEELKDAINNVKKNWTHDGYIMNRLNNYCGKWLRHGGWYPDRKLRLWHAEKGSWTGTNPHDKLKIKESGRVGVLKGDILHYSYNSIREHIEQTNKFTDISAAALYEQGIRSNLFTILFSPVIKFLKDYFLKLGILDGYYGLIVTIISAHATFLKYAKLKQLSND